ncbi:MAG TPA: cell division protein ZapB [Pyrinomonadaceae bacterium]|jgi:hypothetical protein
MSALKLRCPYCGSVGHHPVDKPDSKFYSWSKETTYIFEEHTRRDISLRRRTLKCSGSCGLPFKMVETPEIYLEALIKKVNELRWKNDELSEKNSALEKQNIQLQDELKQVKERAQQLSNLATELTDSIEITRQIESKPVTEPINFKLNFNFADFSLENREKEG